MSARPGRITVLRDTASWIGGWTIIFKQAGILFAAPTQVNETLVWMAAALIGVPGIAQLFALRGGGTAGSPAPSPSSESPPSSPGEPARSADPA